MTIENILIFVIMGAALLLFISEKIRVDLVALMVLVSLTLTGLITPEEAFSGFASPAVITVWAVFIISGGFSDESQKLFFYLVFGKKYHFRIPGFEPDIFIAFLGRTLELAPG